MNVYTQNQIDLAWVLYKKAHGWKYLKSDGTWVVRMSAPDLENERITQCKMVKISQVMGFPKYLKIQYGSEND